MAHPTLQAHTGAGRSTAVVAKVVVTRRTLYVARAGVVVFVTLYPDTISDASHGPIVHDCLPGVTRVDHASAGAALNQQVLLSFSCLVVPVPGLYNQRVCPRPSKLEGDHNPASIVDFIRVIVGALKRKRISTDNLRRFSSERAGASGGHLHLIFLQAHFEVSVALVLSAAQVLGAPGTVAALPVRQFAVYILHGDQLQLEIAG